MDISTDSAPIALEGFLSPSTPLSGASKLVEKGRLGLAHIRAMVFDSAGALLVAGGARVEKLDPDTLETVDTWLIGLYVQQLTLQQDEILALVRVGEERLLIRGCFGGEYTTLVRGNDLLGIATAKDGSIALSTSSGVRLLNADGSLRGVLSLPDDYESDEHISVSPSGRYVSCGGWLWCDGELVMQEIHVNGNFSTSNWPSRLGPPPSDPNWKVEQRARRGFTRVLSDTAVAEGGRVVELPGLENSFSVRGNQLIAGGDRMVGLTSEGWSEVDPTSGDEVASQTESYFPGKVLGVVREKHLAVYRNGSLLVKGPKGTARRAYVPSIASLSVSAAGDRLALSWEYILHHGLAIDLKQRISYALTWPEYTSSAAATVSESGEHIWLENGQRELIAVPFGGSEPARIAKTLKRSTIIAYGADHFLVATTLFNVATYGTRGWIAVFKEGKKRAVAKAKIACWAPCISTDGTTVAAIGADGILVLDVTKKFDELEAIPDGIAVALGSARNTVAYVTKDGVLHLRCGDHRSDRPTSLVPGLGAALCFSEDESALFVAVPDHVEVYDTSTGTHVQTLATGVMPKSLVLRGGLLWLLGEESEVVAYGAM